MASMTLHGIVVRLAGRQVDTVVTCRWGVRDRPTGTRMVIVHGVPRQFRLEGITRKLLAAANYKHVRVMFEFFGEHASGAANTSVILACVKPQKHDMGLCHLPNFIDDACGSQIEVRVSDRASAVRMPPPPPPPRSQPGMVSECFVQHQGIATAFTARDPTPTTHGIGASSMAMAHAPNAEARHPQLGTRAHMAQASGRMDHAQHDRKHSANHMRATT